MLSTISSIRPRVFIRAPSARRVAPAQAGERAASMLPPNLPAMATTMISAADQPVRRVVEQADLGAQAGEGEEQRQQEDRAERLQPLAQERAEPPVRAA